MAVEKIKILGAVLELPSKQHCQFSPFDPFSCCLIGFIGSAGMIFLWSCSTPPEVTLTPWNPTRLSGTSLFFLYTPSKHCLQTFFSHCQSEINDFFSRVFESCDHQKYANYKHMQASSRTTFKFIYPNYCTHWL